MGRHINWEDDDVVVSSFDCFTTFIVAAEIMGAEDTSDGLTFSSSMITNEIFSLIKNRAQKIIQKFRKIAEIINSYHLDLEIYNIVNSSTEIISKLSNID